MAPRLTLATCSLAGCFGCHMSLLDLDEGLVGLLRDVDLRRSPLTDLKVLAGTVDLGLVEGAVGSEADVETARDFRRHCRVLAAVGECAVSGGIPSLRNGHPVAACLAEAYRRHPGGAPGGSGDAELPRLLDRVHPLQEVVKVDVFLPGCPPPPEALRHVIDAVREGRDPSLPPGLLRYD